MASAAVATSLPTTPGSGPASSPAGNFTTTMGGASGGGGNTTAAVSTSVSMSQVGGNAATSTATTLPSGATPAPSNVGASFNLNATTGSDFAPARTTLSSGIDTTTSYEQSRRQVSSVVISEQLLGDLPEQGGVRYIEVPYIEEVVRMVPGKREVREVEKIVPKYEYEWIEKTVEVPQIHYIDRPVEVEKIQEVIRQVPVRSIQEVPREVIKTVPKIEYRRVEKTVEVPGEIIERASRVVVENPVHVKRYIDRNEPVVVAQTICPIVTESAEVIDVDVFEYEPQVIPIDVHVAKPIPSHLTAIGATSEIHQQVTVPAAQYNTLLRQLNNHLVNEADALPYIRPDGTGHIPFLTQIETPAAVAPNPAAMIHPQGTVDVSRPFAATGVSTTAARSVAQIASTSTAGGRGMIQQTTSSVGSFQPYTTTTTDMQMRGIVGSSADLLYQNEMQQQQQQRSMSQQMGGYNTTTTVQTRGTHGGSMAMPSYPQSQQSQQQQQQQQHRPTATSNMTANKLKDNTGAGAGSVYSASIKTGQRPSRPSHIPQGGAAGSAAGTKTSRRYTGQGVNSYLAGNDNPNTVMVGAHKRRPCEC